MVLLFQGPDTSLMSYIIQYHTYVLLVQVKLPLSLHYIFLFQSGGRSPRLINYAEDNCPATHEANKPKPDTACELHHYMLLQCCSNFTLI